MSQRFANKIALVTGAANGLGRATALGFAREGASLCLVDIDAAALDDTHREAEGLGARVLAVPVNLDSRATCHRVIDDAVAHFGKLDVLCNIAGIVRMHHLADITENDWNSLMTINLAAPFWLSQAAMPHLIASHGNIVNCASQSSLKGSAYIVPYSMTKAAINMMTRSMAMEFINSPVRINAVSPGTMANTNMTKGASFPEGLDPNLFMRYSGIRPASEPEDVASMFLYAASDDARAVHGAILCADGGTTAD
ncbi:MAG: SDR family oxidoreductase [Trueperaceae bacterium]